MAGVGKLTSDSPLFERLLEVLELKGYALSEASGLSSCIIAHASTFRSFDDPYLVELVELPDDEYKARLRRNHHPYNGVDCKDFRCVDGRRRPSADHSS